MHFTDLPILCFYCLAFSSSKSHFLFALCSWVHLPFKAWLSKMRCDTHQLACGLYITLILKECGHKFPIISVCKKPQHIHLCKVQPLWIFEQVWLPVIGVHLSTYYQKPILKEHLERKRLSITPYIAPKRHHKPWCMEISIEWCYIFSLALMLVQLAWTVSVKVIKIQSNGNSYFFSEYKNYCNLEYMVLE